MKNLIDKLETGLIILGVAGLISMASNHELVSPIGAGVTLGCIAGVYLTRNSQIQNGLGNYK